MGLLSVAFMRDRLVLLASGWEFVGVAILDEVSLGLLKFVATG